MASTPQIVIRHSWYVRMGEYQGTEYEGAKDDLIAVGLAKPEMFEVGSAGTKSRTGSLPREERYQIRRMAHGRWRLKRWHDTDKPPYLPPGTVYDDIISKI